MLFARPCFIVAVFDQCDPEAVVDGQPDLMDPGMEVGIHELPGREGRTRIRRLLLLRSVPEPARRYLQATATQLLTTKF
jgi:hypothetical protein